jgi:hypothetical protein
LPALWGCFMKYTEKLAQVVYYGLIFLGAFLLLIFLVYLGLSI